jgi:transaldolase
MSMKNECLYQGKIKVFADGADQKTMLELAKNPVVQGFTTNPTLMKQAGVKDYRAFSKELLSQIRDRGISFEVFADEFGEMHRQALEIASWGPNVYVKIPITNSRGDSSIPLIKDLGRQGVKLNVTAVFTPGQIAETCQALKGAPPSLLSVFAGRIADAGYDPMPIMSEAARQCASADRNIELLWASSREVYNVIQAEQSGCKVITCTPDIIKKMASFKKDLGQFSLETVQMFKRDAEAAGYKL